MTGTPEPTRPEAYPTKFSLIDLHGFVGEEQIS